MMDFHTGASVEDIFEYAKAEVHDGDLFLIRIHDPVTEKQLRAFRRQVAERTEELGWKERGILCLVVGGNVDVVSAKGPVRLEPRPGTKFDLEEGIEEVTALLTAKGMDMTPGSNIHSIATAVLAAIAVQFDGTQGD